MTDTYPPGMAIVIWVVFGVLTLISLLELVCVLMRWPSMGYRVEAWSLRNPWFAGALLLVLGMLLAHFFLNPLPPTASSIASLVQLGAK